MSLGVEPVLERIRARGGRVTSARRAIVSALLEADGHVTAEQLTERVRRRHPEIHETTVYRCLDALAELDVVDHVHLGHGGATYHLAGERHQHLLCERCGAVTEVPEKALAGLTRQLAKDYGFALRPHHFAFLGECSGCSSPARGPS